LSVRIGVSRRSKRKNCKKKKKEEEEEEEEEEKLVARADLRVDGRPEMCD